MSEQDISEEFYLPVKQMTVLVKHGSWSRGMILA